MKRHRIFTGLLALVMLLALLPTAALAADNGPPYSLKYLDGIEGAEYLKYWEFDDYVASTGEVVTQYAIDIYDALYLCLEVYGDWSKMVAPFRQRFKDAGFTEEIRLDDNNDEQYGYTDGSGALFLILGKTKSQAVINDSGMVYVVHGYSTKFMGGEAAAQIPTGDIANFTETRAYTPGLFTDVSADAWYASGVQTAYELGLVNGSGAAFAPANPISVAETLALACRIHSIYYGGDGVFTQGSPWYQVYVDYALENGILAGELSDYTASANRQVFASIMAKALPDTALVPINDIEAEAIPDSSSIDASSLPAVLRLYNAGILTGSDAQGSFNPASSIQRSEVATIVSRMAVPSQRKTLSLTPGDSLPGAGTGSENSAPPSSTSMDYAYRALDYLYGHLKFPSTMNVISIRCGEYDRVAFYEGAPDMMKPSGAILPLNDDYYVVVITLQAANSFGAMTTDSYVTLFDVTTGKTYYDLVGYADSAADDAFGSRKFDWMDVESEGLILAATIKFPELSREEIAQLVEDVKK